jgi:hypothetical protein
MILQLAVMFVVFIVAFIFIVLLVEPLDGGDLIAPFILSMGAAIASAGFVGIIHQNATYGGEPVATYEQEIISLNISSDLSGRFFLGSGRVEDDPVYVYQVETEWGTHIETIKMDGVSIRESDGTEPKIVEYRYTDRVGFDEWYKRGMFIDRTEPPLARTVIYVPEETVVTEFNVDIEDY